MIWNPVESIPRADMEALQLERLRWSVARTYDRVAAFRAKMDAAGVRPEHIRTLADIRLLPLTTKEDLRSGYPFGLFASPVSEMVRFHASSGTTGKPVVAGYTRGDMEMWTDCCARVAGGAGLDQGDIAQVSFGYGMFTGGLGMHYGLERLGCTVIPASAGNTERQIMFMQDFGVTAMISTPSYALHLAEIIEDNGIDLSTFRLRTALFGGEGHTHAMKTEIERRLGILDTQNYGLTEICGPGVSFECLESHGHFMHINEDHFYPEIIDPDTGEVLPEGAEGEMLLTTLTKEGIPMLRYRTKDITSLHRGPCACGRTTVRMDMVKGRSDDMMIIRGVNVFPSQIESVLMTVKGIGPHYLIVVTTEKALDRIEVQVEVIDGALLDRYSELERLRDEIRHKLRVVLQIDARVTLLNPKTLERSTGKSKRVDDRRAKAF
ncbi:MAG TPA: phenylacetate--CoA ligase [Clostridia bacterium]